MKQTVSVAGRNLTLSNLDKVLYPNGCTKAQVLDYYMRVSDYLLPHLKNRPITMKRFPDGVDGQSFYEKDAPDFTPAWIRTFPVERKTGGEPIRYILINTLPVLIWCANLASLEIHPFLHKAPQIERPTSVAFDLDPGEGQDILACARAAFLLKEFLDEIELQSFPKVSGSKGIQLYVPINSPVTYDATRSFARSVARVLEKMYPDRIVSDMKKSLRAGKVLIDWSQNSDFKTTISVYSLRAKSDRPYVSLPVEWDELREAVKRKDASSLQFEARDALLRLKRTGDLFSPVLVLKQKLRAPLMAELEKRAA